MPISGTKKLEVDTSIRFVNGSPWPIRVNNAGAGGGFALDSDRILVKGSLDTVILGYRPLLGVLPPRSTYDSFIDALKSPELPAPGRLSPMEMMIEFGRKHLAPHVFITHVPLPSALDAIPDNFKDYWPKGVVTGSFVRSIGLTGGSQSLLGSMGLIPLLETSGKNLVDVVTSIGFEKKESPGKSYHINTFEAWTPTAEDTEAFAHIKACRKFIEGWVKDNPEATDFPLPSDTLMVDLPASEILNPGQVYADLAVSILTVQAQAVFPPAEQADLNIPQVVETLMLTGSLSALAPAAAADLAVSTIEVKPID
jgi:hypothetical protein